MDTNVEIWKAGVDRWEERYGAWQEGFSPKESTWRLNTVTSGLDL